MVQVHSPDKPFSKYTLGAQSGSDDDGGGGGGGGGGSTGAFFLAPPRRAFKMSSGLNPPPPPMEPDFLTAGEGGLAAGLGSDSLLLAVEVEINISINQR